MNAGAPTLRFCIVGGYLEPGNDLTREWMRGQQAGDYVSLEIVKSRSRPQLRLYWSILDHVAKASKWEHRKKLHTALLLVMGEYDLMQLPSGRTVPVPHSIALETMPHKAFQEFFDGAMKHICEDIVPHLDQDGLIDEVMAMLGGPAPEYDGVPD
jgi:hypothetical protein